MERLSAYMLRMAEEFEDDWIDDFDEENQDEIRETEREMKKLTVEFVRSRHRFADASVVGFDKMLRQTGPRVSDLIQRRLDEYYTRELLAQIPKIVSRTLRVSQIVSERSASAPLAMYLAEATRSYIFGFWQSTVALARAAVEEGLKERVEERLRPRKTKLCELVTTAIRLKILDDANGTMASRVEVAGNLVLHGKPLGDREAWDTLVAARGILSHLYGVSET